MQGQEYIDQLKQKIASWNESIRQLEEAAQNSDAQGAAAYKREIAAIKENRDELTRKLDEIAGTSGERWDDIMGSIQETVGNLESKIANAFKK